MALVWLLVDLAAIALLAWAGVLWRQRSLGQGHRLGGGGWRWVVPGQRSRKGGSTPHRVALALPIASPLHFEIRPENWLSRLERRLGFATDATIGDAGFDHDVNLLCDEPQLAQWLRSQRAVATTLRALVTDVPDRWRLQRLACRAGVIRIDMVGELDAHTSPQEIAEAALTELYHLVADLAGAPTVPSTASQRFFRLDTRLRALAVALVIAPLLIPLRPAFWDGAMPFDADQTRSLIAATAIVLLVGLLAATATALRGSVRRKGTLSWMVGVGGIGAVLTAALVVHDAGALLAP